MASRRDASVGLRRGFRGFLRKQGSFVSRMFDDGWYPAEEQGVSAGAEGRAERKPTADLVRGYSDWVTMMFISKLDYPTYRKRSQEQGTCRRGD